MTTRQHLRKVHERAADFHLQAAKHHSELAKCFGKLGKAEGMEETASEIAQAHEGLAQQHMDLSEFNVQCCKSLDAAAKSAGMGGGDDLDRIVPDRISVLAPEQPVGLRAIPRAGAPPMPSVEVDDMFGKIYVDRTDE
jgi:hypothetical protein